MSFESSAQAVSRRHYLLVSTLLLAVLVNFAGAAASAQSLSSQSAPTDLVATLDRPQQTRAKHLAYGQEPYQFGELWLPKGSGPFPVMIMIHGGCWQASLPGLELMSPLAKDMQQSGFAVWNIEYRRLGHDAGGYPGTFLDIADGVDHLRKIATAYKLDLSHVIVVGHSAGGHLALWAAGRNKLAHASKLYRPDPLPLSYVVTLAGIDDLKSYHDHGPSACGGPHTIEELVSSAERPHEDAYADTSPAALLPLHVRQLMVSGMRDPIVPDTFGADYAALAKAKGDKVEVLDIRDAGHFELIDPTSSAWKQIKKILLSIGPAK